MSDKSEESDSFITNEVSSRVEALWAKVFETSSKVLHQHKVFGFNGMETIPNPNIHERLIALQIFSAIIDVLLSSSSSKSLINLEYEQTRQLLNAKAQITKMEQLAAALIAKNEEDYLEAVQALEGQAVF